MSNKLENHFENRWGQYEYMPEPGLHDEAKAKHWFDIGVECMRDKKTNVTELVVKIDTSDMQRMIEQAINNARQMYLTPADLEKLNDGHNLVTMSKTDAFPFIHAVILIPVDKLP